MIRGAVEDDVLAAVDVVRRWYNDNVSVEISGSGGTRVPWVRFRLRVDSSRGPGARRSSSGRRTVAACWHVHRDVFGIIFGRLPQARITTAMADYKGAQGFRDGFLPTFDANVGNAFQHVRFGALCECNGNDPVAETDAGPVYLPIGSGPTSARGLGATEYTPGSLGPDAATGMTLDELLGEADRQSAEVDEVLGGRR